MPGTAFLALPHDQPTAAMLLQMADDTGVGQHEIRTTEDGYYVPDAIAELLYPISEAPEDPKE